MLTWFRNQTLVFKLMLLTILVSLAITLMNTLAHMFYYSEKQEKIARADIESSIRTFIPSLVSAIEQNDIDQKNAIVNALSSLNGVNNLKVSSEVSSTGTPQKHTANVLILDVDTSIGPRYLVVSLRESIHPDDLKYAALFELISGTLQVSIIGAFVFFFAQKLIFRHLRKVAEYSEHLSVETLGTPLKLNRSENRTSDDELDLVVNALENMRSHLIDDIDNQRSMEIALLREKEENQEAKKLIEDAQTADRAKSQFIATMSHEIRTPMNGIIGMVQMLQETKIDEEQKNYLNIISRSSNALMHIINDILDFSKIESGKMNLDRESFSLEKHVHECIQLFIGVANAKNIHLIGNIDPDVPKNVHSDSKRLLQVLTNLIGNAFKFTENGCISINVELNSRTTKDCWLRFSVKDTGIGVDEKDQKNIFFAYKQADESMTRKYGGTGLGLSICKHIVDLMDGEIGLNSKLNKGSEFWFTAKFGIDTSEAIKQIQPHETSAQSILYIDPSDDTRKQFERHANHLKVNHKVTDSVDKAISSLAKSVHANVICVLNNIHDLNELQELKKVVEEREAVSVYILAAGKSYRQLKSEGTLKNHVLLRPLFIQQIFSFVASQNAKQMSRDETRPAPSENRGKSDLSALVAEDNAVNRIVIEGLLKKLDIKPRFAHNGEEAVNAYCDDESAFDLIFMDCEMPIMDGFDATERIREWETSNNRSNTPIIALTAHVESSYKERCFESGMNVYISKPVTVEKLDEVIKELSEA